LVIIIISIFVNAPKRQLQPFLLGWPNPEGGLIMKMVNYSEIKTLKPLFKGKEGNSCFVLNDIKFTKLSNTPILLMLLKVLGA
jgi:hypothetical protein